MLEKPSNNDKGALTATPLIKWLYRHSRNAVDAQSQLAFFEHLILLPIICQRNESETTRYDVAGVNVH